MSVLLVCIVLLCGCTRREQLVLETEGSLQTAQEADRTESDEAQDGDVTKEYGQTTQGQENVGADAAGLTQNPAPEERTVICVHVCGAVKNAGVYELPEGSRVFEAVKEAGGFTEEADENYVNQAQQLIDGSKLVIPTTEQVQKAETAGEDGTKIGIVEQAAVNPSDGYEINGRPDSDAGGGSDNASDGRININTASETQLCEIPGIGAARAAAIVAYRQESGGFRSIEDIMNVSGIKEGTYAKIKDSIKVE